MIRSALIDEESRIIPALGGGFEQSYNAHAVTCTEAMLILAACVNQPANDKEQVEPMIRKVQANPEGLDRPETSPSRIAMDGEHFEENRCMGLPVFAFCEIDAHRAPDEYDMFVAVGYARLNKARAQKCLEARSRDYRWASYVSSRSVNWPGLSIGEKCFMMEGNIIQQVVRIGNNVIIWCGSFTSNHIEIDGDCFIAAHAVVSDHVKIGAQSFIGANAALRDKVTFGERTLVGAGALVAASTEENTAYLAAISHEPGIPSHRLQSLL